MTYAYGGTWEFLAPPITPSRDEVVQFESALGQALQQAAGLQLRLGLTWSSGPLGRLRLTGSGERLSSWMDRVITPAYGAGRWSLCRSERVRVFHYDRRVGRPKGSDRPFSVSQAGHWGDGLLDLMRSLPAGLEVAWTFGAAGGPPRPSALGTLSDWLDPPPVRSPARGTLGRGPPPLPDPATSPPASGWTAEACIAAVTPRAVGAIDLAAKAIAGVCESFRRPVGFRPPPKLWSAASPTWWMEMSQVAGAWPSLRAREPCAAPPSAYVGPRWAVGRTLTGGQVALAYAPAEGRHLGILGETGMGKSSLLVDLAVQSTRQANVVVIDPIGDVARRFIEQLPTGARERTRVISSEAPSETFNALHPSGRTADVPGRNVSNLVTALRRVRLQRYADQPFWGPRIEETLYRALALCDGSGRGTLFDAWRLLEGDSTALADLHSEAEHDAHRFLQHIARHPEDVDGARRLLGEVSRAEVLRGLLSDPNPSWTFDAVDSEASITVVSGDAPVVGEATAKTVATIFVGLLWAHLLGRSPSRKLCLVLDEVQWYAQEAIAEALRLARRLNVHVWFATQSLDSLPDSLHDAAETNVAEWAIFRGGGDGLRWLDRQLRSRRRWPEGTPGVGEAVWVEGRGRTVQLIRVATSAASRDRHQPGPSPSGPSGVRDGGREPTAQVNFPQGPSPAEGSPLADRRSAPTDWGPPPEPRVGCRIRVYWAGLFGSGLAADGRCRALGGLLGRNGWILGSGTDGQGRYWDVSSAAQAALERAGVGAAARGITPSDEPSLPEAGPPAGAP